MIKCPNCGRENADNFNFCLDCGYDLKAYREAFTSASLPAMPIPAPPPPKPVAAPSAPLAVAAPPPAPLAVAAPPPAPPAAAAPPPPAPVAAPPPPKPVAPPPLAAPAAVAAPRPPAPLSAPPPPVTIPPMSAAPLAAPLPAPAPAPAPPAAAAGKGETCPACSHDNAPGVRFCGNCGKRLDGGGPDAPGHAAARTMFMHAAGQEPAGKDKTCKLVTIDQTGREGMTFTLRSGETLCGRVNGVVLFDDPFVSPTHCKFNFAGGKLKVLDQESLNGIYLRVRDDRKLADGELLRVGRQLYRFERLTSAAIQIKKPDADDSRIWGSPHPGAFARIIQILDDGRTGEIRLLSGERCQLGREVGDIVIPSDGFISGRHCVFIKQGDDVVVQDLGSSNGTYVRVRKEADVAHGDFLLVGNQMLRVEIV